MEIRKIPASSSVTDAVSAIRNDGVVIIEKAVSEETIDRLMTEMGPYIEATEVGPDDFSGHNTTRTGSLLARV